MKARLTIAIALVALAFTLGNGPKTPATTRETVPTTTAATA